jgi:serine/threonine-protein kinase
MPPPSTVRSERHELHQSESPARPRLVFERLPSGGDLEPLLRIRLRIAALLAAATSVFFATYRTMQPGQLEYFLASALGTGVLVFEGLFGLSSLVLAAVLWQRERWTLPTLRILEVALVACFAIYIAWAQLVAWSGGRFVFGGSSTIDPFVMRQAVDSMAGRWVALIVGISTLVPETSRRTGAMVAALALTALAVTTYMGLTDVVYRPHLVAMLALMFFWMVIASTIAMFGSYKLAELRQQVQEARQLGQYRLLRHIGSGGMGEVHLAEHTMLKQPCAIKVLRPELARDPRAMQRFEREVRAMSRLRHWNTVQIYDYGYADDGTFYYAMEYLPGVTLQQLVARGGPLPPSRAIHFLRQVCAALREAHAMQLVHRDIKPANIIVGERAGLFDVAKLLDFGMVRRTGLDSAAETLTGDNLVIGTPAYMSPEQVGGGAEVDSRSDIYSVGAVGYFLVTGRPPFERGTAVQVLMAHLNDPPVPPGAVLSDVPADLEDALLRCLTKDPAQRLGDASALDATLARCQDAGSWTQEQAAAWWREHTDEDETAEP